MGSIMARGARMSMVFFSAVAVMLPAFFKVGVVARRSVAHLSEVTDETGFTISAPDNYESPVTGRGESFHHDQTGLLGTVTTTPASNRAGFPGFGNWGKVRGWFNHSTRESNSKLENRELTEENLRRFNSGSISQHFDSAESVSSSSSNHDDEVENHDEEVENHDVIMIQETREAQNVTGADQNLTGENHQFLSGEKTGENDNQRSVVPIEHSRSGENDQTRIDNGNRGGSGQIIERNRSGDSHVVRRSHEEVNSTLNNSTLNSTRRRRHNTTTNGRRNSARRSSSNLSDVPFALERFLEEKRKVKKSHAMDHFGWKTEASAIEDWNTMQAAWNAAENSGIRGNNNFHTGKRDGTFRVLSFSPAAKVIASFSPVTIFSWLLDAAVKWMENIFSGENY